MVKDETVDWVYCEFPLSLANTFLLSSRLYRLFIPSMIADRDVGVDNLQPKITLLL